MLNTIRLGLNLQRNFISTQTRNMNFIKGLGSVVTSSILEKPQFEAVNVDKGIEERQYTPAKWVSTSIKGMNHEAARSQGFQRLFKYITGSNEKGIKVDMTAPVTTKIEPGAGPNCENTFTVSFYIPPKHQDDPPKPTNPDVFIEERPGMKVLVTTFGGFAKEESWLSEAQKLTEQVEKSNQTCRQDYWYSASYNSPFQLFGRTNEVWFIKSETD